MSITSYIKEITRLSGLITPPDEFNATHYTTGPEDALRMLASLDQEEIAFRRYLDSLPAEKVVVICNLMYVGKEITPEEETFMSCYARINNSLRYTKSDAIFKLIEKRLLLDELLNEAIRLAERESISLDYL